MTLPIENFHDSARDPYRGYAYSYPHKTAYRPLEPPVLLSTAWKDERRDALFLYLHIPFCEMRCGFCNLFTRSLPGDSELDAYLAAFRRQALRVQMALGEARYSRLAVGGGTPTFIGARRLEALFDIAERDLGAEPSRIPVSVETSPGMADIDSLRLLRSRGVRRLSVGIQSFDDAELSAAGRPERTARTLAALERIRSVGFPVVNLDLIYGIPGQTPESWLATLRAALAWAPGELYLYPLYVRPRTGLSRRRVPEDRRLELYRIGRTLLLQEGYAQESMRMFRRPGVGEEGPLYCCQDDGMVGLGCGARSYTRRLHYSTPYAVTREGVRRILAEYASRSDEQFDHADHGVVIDAGEEKRRWLIKSLLRARGFSPRSYEARFGSSLDRDFEGLADLEERGWLVRTAELVRLTPEGLEFSDAIGPWLYSGDMVRRMESHVPA